MRPIISLALLAAVAMLQGAPVRAAEMPQVGAIVNYVAARVQVLVNGIPVQEIDVDKDTSGGTGMQLTD